MGYLLLGIGIAGILLFGFLLFSSPTRFYKQRRKKLSEIEENL